MSAAQPFRVPEGGLIDREAPLRFTFDGRRFEGYLGDTLASALAARGERLLGRSLKYHRPRGLVAAGGEEPNALVTVGEGARREPNLRATQVELYDGLVARSQNRWPTLAFDLGALAGPLGGLLAAGFYYKTFMWPRRGWRLYEGLLRRAAGLGRAPREPDPDRYAHKHAHFDVVVVGAGPSGLAAALAAGCAGAQVLLVEDSAHLGGSLLGLGAASPERGAAAAWLGAARAELDRLPGVTVALRTTAFGYYDQDCLALAERVTDHLSAPDPHLPRHRLWYVRARRVVLATGAIERPVVFAGNDRPGVMLASAARRYLNQYAVRSAQRAVLFTNNDTAYPVALELAEAGTRVALVADARAEGPAPYWSGRLAHAGIELAVGHAVAATRGGRSLREVELHPLLPGGEHAPGRPRRVACDGLLVSGGWTPTVHLLAQAGGAVRWREDRGAFVPAEDPAPGRVRCVGTMTGALGLSERVREGLEGGVRAAGEAGQRDPRRPELPSIETGSGAPLPDPGRLWQAPDLPRARGPRFVDLQNDVTTDDIELAVREGYRSVEHLKRYTTLGMGTDQGRLGNLNGLARLARARGEPVAQVGLTTFRPPFAPVSLGALAGDARGPDLAPYRLTPLHDWHLARGARMLPSGGWLRPECYPRGTETPVEAARREGGAVRRGAGMVDVSTLGKIELQGPDAALFLERIYMNRWRSLPVGRVRYGVMLRDDGMVLDDGTTARLGPEHYYLTTTTGEAERVLEHLERHARVSWPALDVDLVPVTDQWGALALAGPCSREVLARAVDVEVGDAALPHMGCCEAHVAGVPCRILRITFSGELAFEVHAPAGFALAVWEALLGVGEPLGLVPYGTEAMAALRIEKGHPGASEIDGRTTPGDLGLARLMRADGRFVGRRAGDRAALTASGRLQLVGVRSIEPGVSIPRGAHLVSGADLPAAIGRRARRRVRTEGHVTASAYGPQLDAHVGLALLADGRTRRGERLHAVSPLAGTSVEVEVVDPVFVDPAGARARG